MKLIASLLLAQLAASCTLHVHIHEAPAPAVAQPASRWERTVRGVVRDSSGAGVRAYIAAVRAEGGGSNSTGTASDGRFALPEPGTPDFVLHASTEDGRVATARSQPNDGEFELVLAPGATFVIELEGREKARCAVFAGGLRIEDFTLKAGTPARVVVPEGEQRVRIYEDSTVLQERHFSVPAGHTEEIRMQPHS